MELGKCSWCKGTVYGLLRGTAGTFMLCKFFVKEWHKNHLFCKKCYRVGHDNNINEMPYCFICYPNNLTVDGWDKLTPPPYVEQHRPASTNAEGPTVIWYYENDFNI